MSRPVFGGCRCPLPAAASPCVCITTVFASSLRLHHPRVCITPVSASPPCLCHPCVCLHPTWPPPPRHLCVPSSSIRVPGTGFRAHPQNGGPHLYLISSAKTLSPKVSLSEVPGGCDLGGVLLESLQGIQKYSEAWCPTASLSHQEASTSLLFSSIRADRMKTKITESLANSSNDHSLV